MEDNIFAESLKRHEQYHGKIRVECKFPLETTHDLSLAYTPGVSQPCVEISKDLKNAYRYTAKGNLVAVISDGSSVLSLGNVGPYAAIPVMEGKSVLFKKFGEIDAFPICLDTQDSDEIVKIVEIISPVFGGILLEDISAPRCFEIEEKLKKRLNIPVFHDDQHGTAIVVAAALINSLKIMNYSFKNIKVVINGAGAAGIAIAKFLKDFEVEDILLCDTKGLIYEGRQENMSPCKNEIAKITNKTLKKGSLTDAMVGAHVFIGVSKPDVISPAMIRSMQRNPIIFALSNPVPEIMPNEAKKAGAAVICTGRSDFPNQVNNVLIFPGIFRGALNARASSINQTMKRAAALALVNLISAKELTPEYVIPKIFDPRVCSAVAKAVENSA